MKAASSISVDHKTLDQVNRVRGLLEYINFKKLTSDEAILEMCRITENHLLKRMGVDPSLIHSFTKRKISP